jgi:DNA-directed RNA polymerase specialized sigma24 family protein
MSSDGSVSRWLGPLQNGDPAAVQELWQRYFLRLVELARKRLDQRPLHGGDEEDIALSAFDSFCRNAVEGRFPELQDRDNLWRLLVVLTVRKVSIQQRNEARQKRGGGLPAPAAMDENSTLLEQVMSREPTPEMAAEMTEEYERLLRLLDSEPLRQVAIWRMEGHSVGEIAARIGCAPKTIKRKLKLIRDHWEGELVP